jgi:hypothetical protein
LKPNPVVCTSFNCAMVLPEKVRSSMCCLSIINQCTFNTLSYLLLDMRIGGTSLSTIIIIISVVIVIVVVVGSGISRT